jgi:hypothetical protein
MQERPVNDGDIRPANRQPMPQNWRERTGQAAANISDGSVSTYGLPQGITIKFWPFICSSVRARKIARNVRCACSK